MLTSRLRRPVLFQVLVVCAALWSQIAGAQAVPEAVPFVGKYAGSATLSVEDQSIQRDMSVEIAKTKDGFTVQWTSTTYRADGRVRENSYTVEFRPAPRGDLMSAAMQTNMFGHAVPLDPMKGEPFVWGRIKGDTLTVFSLHVHDNGDYDIQQFDRTLVDGGLMLEFKSTRNGEVTRELNAFLERVS